LKLHLFGASGSGVTTLGKNLSLDCSLPFYDADDYFWKKTNPPFVESQPLEERCRLLQLDIAQSDVPDKWVISGSMVSWGGHLHNEMDIAIYLYVPPEIRLKRLRQREFQRFGERIREGGDMFESHEKFIEWANQYDSGVQSGRSRMRHNQWMQTLKCPVLKIEGDYSLEVSREMALTFIKQIYKAKC
jgi:adenylate kinase family enzyme